MKAHPAQANNLALDAMILKLQDAERTLSEAADQLRNTKPVGEARMRLSRKLSGVLGSVEDVRLALNK